MLTLVVTSGSHAGERQDVSRELIVGREDADLSLDDPRMSRRHFSLAPAASGGVEIRDLGSSNGTCVDGRRIDGVVTVTGAVTILAGSTTLELKVAPGATVVDGATVLGGATVVGGDATVVDGEVPVAAPPPPPPKPAAAPPPPPRPEAAAGPSRARPRSPGSPAAARSPCWPRC